MDIDEALQFIRANHHGVIATTRNDGRTAMSPIACDVDADGRVVVSTRETAMKVKSSDLTMIPTTSVALEQEDKAKSVLRLMDALEDHDDVEAVYANFDIPDAVLEAVSA